MKSKLILAGFAAAFLVNVGLMNAAHANPSAKAAKVASITLYGKDENNSCSFSLEVGNQYTMRSKNCKNDDYYYFKITGGQPNTLLVFMDHPQCGYSQPTYQYLIVGDEGDVLNMADKRDLEHDGSNGQYLEPHLETRGAPKTGRLKGKLSCIAAW